MKASPRFAPSPLCMLEGRDVVEFFRQIQQSGLVDLDRQARRLEACVRLQAINAETSVKLRDAIALRRERLANSGDRGRTSPAGQNA